jgi:hypothetical protein
MRDRFFDFATLLISAASLAVATAALWNTFDKQTKETAEVSYSELRKGIAAQGENLASLKSQFELNPDIFLARSKKELLGLELFDLIQEGVNQRREKVLLILDNAQRGYNPKTKQSNAKAIFDRIQASGKFSDYLKIAETKNIGEDIALKIKVSKIKPRMLIVHRNLFFHNPLDGKAQQREKLSAYKSQFIPFIVDFSCKCPQTRIIVYTRTKEQLYSTNRLHRDIGKNQCASGDINNFD